MDSRTTSASYLTKFQNWFQDYHRKFYLRARFRTSHDGAMFLVESINRVEDANVSK